MFEIPPSVIGTTWGLLAAAPLLARARRAQFADRLPPAGGRSHAAPGNRLLGRRVHMLLRRSLEATGPIGRVVRAMTARRRTQGASRALERELSDALDLLAVAVGAGCTPYLAVEIAARWAPPLIAGSFSSVLGACALGASFADALDDVARSTPRLRVLADALLASERLGAPVGPALARLAAEERTALRRRAETHARKVPVRLLFPLVFLVLPAFVLLTVVPGLAAGLARL
jgi:pilus assembly protein TadC